MQTLPRIVLCASVLVSCPGWASAQDAAEKWIPLFNGQDLEGWTPKITRHPLRENFGNTFRVENGVLKVVYDQYDNFAGQFGHLFYREPFSHYRLRVEYRFVAEQVPGGPDWAARNSGIMIHCQPPETMQQNQNFPVSIEIQLLGGRGNNEKRPTANVCTPGTHVVMNGQLVKRHCTNSTSQTFYGDQWVTVEVEVRGNEVVRHIIDGKTVLEYSEPQLDEQDADAQRLLRERPEKRLSSGYISLQSESHPVEFRKVELLRLDK
jgi:hypothetical protein